MTTPAIRTSPCPTPFTDHIYKIAAGVEVPLRIWPAEKPRGWLLWFHGGAFMAGKHAVPNAWVVPAFRARRYVVVSAAYRYAPHASLADILEDCQDALAFCRKYLPSLGVDVDSYAVGGDSAGGYLSTMCAHLFERKPRVVLDVFGVTDLTDAYMHQPKTPELSGRFSREEIEAALKERDPRNAKVIAAWDWEMEPNMSVKDLQSFWGMAYTPGREDRLRMDMVKCSMLFPELLRAETLSAEEYKDKLREYSPLLRLEGTYPPTAFLHGHKDEAVPIAHSVRFADKLREMGVDVIERYSPDGGHCFENFIEYEDDEGWDEYIVPVLDFVDAHIGKSA